jgi:allantoinase
MNDLNIIDGTIVSTKEKYRASIGIKDGRIAQIGSRGSLKSAAENIDARDMLVMPGMIDTHVHIRGGRLGHREDFFSGTAAAAAGGVTTIIEMPVAAPPASTPDAFRARGLEASENACIDFCMYAGAGAENTDKLASLAECGAAGFKTFTLPPPAGREQEFYGLCSEDDSTLVSVMKEIKKTGLVLAVHAEDQSEIAKASHAADGCKNRDLISYEMTRPKAAEISAINRVIKTAGETGCRTLVCHVSVEDGLKCIADARKKGVSAYAETCPQYLVFDTESVNGCGVFARVKPPIRSSAERKKLIACVSRGWVDVIGSDHAPYLAEEKLAKGNDVFNTVDGIPGIEMSLTMLLGRVRDGELGFEDIVRIFSENASKLFGLYPEKGQIAEGADADIVLVKKLDSAVSVSSSGLFTKSRDSAVMFDGMKRDHSIYCTIAGGRVAFMQGNIIAQRGSGEFIKPHLLYKGV